MKSTEMIQELVDYYEQYKTGYTNDEILHIYPLMAGIKTLVTAINELTDAVAKKGLGKVE